MENSVSEVLCLMCFTILRLPGNLAPASHSIPNCPSGGQRRRHPSITTCHNSHGRSHKRNPRRQGSTHKCIFVGIQSVRGLLRGLYERYQGRSIPRSACKRSGATTPTFGTRRASSAATERSKRVLAYSRTCKSVPMVLTACSTP